MLKALLVKVFDKGLLTALCPTLFTNLMFISSHTNLENILLCSFHFPLPPAMPRLRHRMRCRRGSSHGWAYHSQSPPNSDSLSEYFPCKFTSETRGRRGIPRGPISAPPSVHPPSPFVFSQAPPVCPSAAPSVPHPHSSSSLRQSSQRVDFTFDCLFERSVLKAHVMVTVCEEYYRMVPPPSAMPSPSVTFHGPIAPSPAPAKFAKDTLAQLNFVSNVSMQVQNMEGVDKDKVAPSDDEGGSSDEFEFRIVEEPPSSTDAQ